MVNYLSAAYTYDGNGLRVNKVSGSATTVYVFSGSKVIAEYDNGAAVGSPSREYIYSGRALLAKIDSSGTKYYHQDHLSNRLVTDSSGNTVAQMGHFPFGESWYNATNDKLLFTSYERDSESGNDYAMARYNMSRLARFSSPDPLSGDISDPQSLNRYPYAGNDTISFVDPTGLNRVANLCSGAYDCSRQSGGSGDWGGGWDSWLEGLLFLALDPNSDFSITGGGYWSNGEWQAVDNLGGLVDLIGPPPLDLQCPLCGPLPQPPPPKPNPCDPTMIAAFNKIWSQTMRFPDRQREATFRLDLTASGFDFQYFIGPVVQPRPGVVPHVTIPDVVPGRTVAIGHTHPDSGFPSGQDRLSPVPNYVVSLFGLMVTDPRNPTAAGDRPLRGSDWGKPCP